MAPSIGSAVLQPNGDWIKVKVVRETEAHTRTSKPSVFGEREIVCLYLLYYGNDHVKVGTSRLEYVVTRTFTQAPPLAIIVTAIQPNGVLPLEYLERRVIDALGQEINLKREKPKLDKVVRVWNDINEGRGTLYKMLETVKKERDPLTALGGNLEKICSVAWNVACKLGEPLCDFAAHWFIPRYPKERLPPPLPKGVKLKPGEIVELKFYSNGLFGICIGQSTIEGSNMFSCDFSFLEYYEYEVIASE